MQLICLNCKTKGSLFLRDYDAEEILNEKGERMSLQMVSSSYPLLCSTCGSTDIYDKDSGKKVNVEDVAFPSTEKQEAD